MASREKVLQQNVYESFAKGESEHLEEQQIATASTGEEVLETRFAHLGRWECMRKFWKCMIYCIILNWAAMNEGFQQQIPGGILPLQAFLNEMGNTVAADGQPALTATAVSVIQGVAEIGKTTGLFIGGYFADKFGRKYALSGAVFLLLMGSVAEVSSKKWQDWLGASLICKLGIGTAQSILITYVSEIAPFQVRGFMMGAFQLLLALGQLISAISVQLIETTQPTKWRPLIATEFIYTGVLIVCLPFVPESPMHFARRGEHDKAKKSLKALYGHVQEYDVDYEYRVIAHGIEAEKAFNEIAAKSSWFEIFQGINLRRTIAGSVGICSQWLAGCVVVFNYNTYFFKAVGFSNAFLVSIITFLLLMITIFISLITCEYIGRRPLLVGGCAAMFFFNLGLASTYWFDTPGAEKAALGCLLLWVMTYGLTVGPLGYVAAGECSTPRLRAKSTSFNFFTYGIGNVTFQWSVSYMISADAANMGVRAIYIWCGLLVPTTVLLYLFYPETTGRTYLELDELYERGISPRHFKNTKTQADLTGSKKKGALAHQRVTGGGMGH